MDVYDKKCGGEGKRLNNIAHTESSAMIDEEYKEARLKIESVTQHDRSCNMLTYMNIAYNLFYTKD